MGLGFIPSKRDQTAVIFEIKIPFSEGDGLEIQTDQQDCCCKNQEGKQNIMVTRTGPLESKIKIELGLIMPSPLFFLLRDTASS